MNDGDMATGPGKGSSSSNALAAGWLALRTFYRPFLIIQAAAVLVVVAYYASAWFRECCLILASWKTRGGLPFAALTGSLAGGLLPELAKFSSDARGERAGQSTKRALSPLFFNLAFFAFNGIVIDLLYRAEARLFGDDAAIATVAAKVAFDQFVFTPLWLPLIVALYLWRARSFSLLDTLTALRAPGFYKKRVLPLLVPDWLFWIPMVSMIYALPSPLQFLLFIFALGAWSLIMVSIATPSSAVPPPPADPVSVSK